MQYLDTRRSLESTSMSEKGGAMVRQLRRPLGRHSDVTRTPYSRVCHGRHYVRRIRVENAAKRHKWRLCVLADYARPIHQQIQLPFLPSFQVYSNRLRLRPGFGSRQYGYVLTNRVSRSPTSNCKQVEDAHIARMGIPRPNSPGGPPRRLWEPTAQRGTMGEDCDAEVGLSGPRPSCLLMPGSICQLA